MDKLKKTKSIDTNAVLNLEDYIGNNQEGTPPQLKKTNLYATPNAISEAKKLYPQAEIEKQEIQGLKISIQNKAHIDYYLSLDKVVIIMTQLEIENINRLKLQQL